MKTNASRLPVRSFAVAALVAVAVTGCGKGGATTKVDDSTKSSDAVTGTFTRSNGTVAPEFQRTTEVTARPGKGGTTALSGSLSSAGKELANDSTELDGSLSEILADKVRSVGKAGKALPKGTECTEVGGSSISVDMTVGGEKVAYEGIMSTPECQDLYDAAENLGIALAGFVPDAFPGLDG